MRLSRCFAAALAAAFAILASTESAVAAEPAWPQSLGDILADPSVSFGELPNGVRYAIRHNATPRGEVSVRFVILAGSMQEGANQHGLAHFLEHMAFHGSTHVTDGDVRATLERMGLRMGPDVNAGTSQLATVYKFDLPSGDDAHVDAALLYAREIASELTLDPKLMDAERGVILSEARAREGAVQDLRQALIADRVGDHPYARPTIGTAQDIKTGSVAALRAFYDAFYRPERAVLVVVGDVDPTAIEAKIKARFSDWTERGAPGADPAPVTAAPVGAPSVKIESAAAAPESGLALVWNQPFQPPALTRADLAARIALIVAEAAITDRVRTEDEAAGTPAWVNGPSEETIPGVARTTEWTALEINDITRTVNLLVIAERQLVQYGLTQGELDRTVARLRSRLEDQQRGTDTRPTPGLADSLVGAALSGDVYLSPAQQLAELDAAVRGLTLARANAMIRAHLTAVPPRLIYYGPPLPAGGEAAINTAFSQAKTAPVTAWVDQGVGVWKHTYFGPPGKVVERREMSEAAATFVRFENGVTLVVKHTEFAKGQFDAAVQFGHGQLDLPRDHVGASDLGVLLFGDGLADLKNAREIGDALIGHHVSAATFEQPDYFEISTLRPGSATPAADLALQMQLIAARLTAPGWRTDDWASWITIEDNSERADHAIPAGVYQRIVAPMLHSGDMRWAPSTGDMRRAWTPRQAEAFIRPIVERSALQVTIVGDVTIDAAIAATAATLGALPARKPLAEPPGLRDVRFPAPPKHPWVLKYDGPLDKALTIVAWPTTDAFADYRQTQAARVLADVMTARLFDELRIKHGWTYSPGVVADFSTALPGYGTITARVTSSPADIPAILDAIDALAADIARNGVSADAFSRAVGPRIEGSERVRQGNAFWLDELSGGQRDPRYLQLQLSAIADLQSLTPDDIRVAAKRWLLKDRAWRIEIVPAAATLAEVH